MKRRLPTDAQLALNAKEDLEVIRRLLHNIERMDEEHAEAMSKMSVNMDKLKNSTADGLLPCGLLLPQQTIYPPPIMFGGHQEPTYPPQVCVHSMYSGHGHEPMYQSQQGKFSVHQESRSLW